MNENAKEAIVFAAWVAVGYFVTASIMTAVRNATANE